jgi:hypothetical protein
MTFLVLLCPTDEVQEDEQSPCVGHCFSEVEVPSRRAWIMIYGWWEIALHEKMDGPVDWPPLEKERGFVPGS